MTEQKSTVPISSLSQSSIAAMKNFLADVRWFLSPPPYTLWRTHRPPLYPIPMPIGVVCRSAVKGEGGRAGTGAQFIFPLYSFLFCHYYNSVIKPYCITEIYSVFAFTEDFKKRMNRLKKAITAVLWYIYKGFLPKKAGWTRVSPSVKIRSTTSLSS